MSAMSDDYCDESLRIRNSPEKTRYEIVVDEQLAGFAQYRLHKGRITFFHTEIFDEYSGKGLAGHLIGHALQDARSQALEVVPLCPYVAAFIKSHSDEYLDLVVPSLRERVMRAG